MSSYDGSTGSDDDDDALGDDDVYDAAVDEACLAVDEASLAQPPIHIEDALADNRLEIMASEVFVRMVTFLDDRSISALRLTRKKIRDLIGPLEAVAIIHDVSADAAFVAAQQAIDADFRERLQMQPRPAAEIWSASLAWPPTDVSMLEKRRFMPLVKSIRDLQDALPAITPLRVPLTRLANGDWTSPMNLQVPLDVRHAGILRQPWDQIDGPLGGEDGLAKRATCVAGHKTGNYEFELAYATAIARDSVTPRSKTVPLTYTVVHALSELCFAKLRVKNAYGVRGMARARAPRPRSLGAGNPHWPAHLIVAPSDSDSFDCKGWERPEVTHRYGRHDDVTWELRPECMRAYRLQEINLAAHFASPDDRVPQEKDLVHGQQRTFTLTLWDQGKVFQRITYHIRQTWDAGHGHSDSGPPAWTEPTIMGFVLHRYTACEGTYPIA